MEASDSENKGMNEIQVLEKETLNLKIHEANANTYSKDLNPQAENADKISDVSSHLTHSSMSICSSAAARGATKVFRFLVFSCLFFAFTQIIIS